VKWRLTTDKNFNKFLVLLYIISSAASQTSSFTTTNVPITARDSFLPQIQTQGLIEDDWVLEKTIDPDLYIVGPGDKFAFNLITSGRITDIKLQINPTGEILIPGIGLLSVDGLTVNQTIEKMKTESLKQYENGIVNIVLEDITQPLH
jgi:protein involved in polysaccharide export with SLBB domain